jgi:molybdate transport system substrate-binding protein
MRAFAAASSLAAMVWVAVPASAAELQVFAAGAVQSVMQDIGPEFERASGHKLTFSFGTVGALQNRIVAGEAADVAVLSVAGITGLAERGLATPEGRATIGTIGSGIAIKAGAARPAIATPDELKVTLLAAKSISYGDPARGATSGIHFAGVLERLGIAEAMKAKTFLVPFGVEAIERVAKGDSELAVSQASEILANPGVVLAGPLPRELQNATTYAATMVASTKSREAVQALLAFIASAPVIAKFRAMGFQAPG